MFLTAPIAAAQPPIDPATIRYYVFDLGEIGPCSDRADYFATGVNDCGVVVGYVEEGASASCTSHGWIWSLCGSFGLPPRTMLDLSVLAGDSGISQAWDVNGGGLVVGYQEVGNASTSRPVVWRADQYNAAGTPPVPRVLLGNGGSGEARGINTPSTGNPTVVGWTVGGSPSNLYTGFKHVFGTDPVTSLTGLAPIALDAQCRAFDVSRAASSSAAPWAVGESSPQAFGASCNDAIGVDTARWALSSSLPVTGLREDFLPASSPLDLDLWVGGAKAVNTQSESAGAFTLDIDPATALVCKKRAAFWRADGTTINLWADQLATFPDRDSEALGMMDSDPSGGGALVVGKDITATEAMGSWRADTPSSPGSASFQSRRAAGLCFVGNGSRWMLNEFQDVNSLGWIVGSGVFDTGIQPDRFRTHGFLMVPMTGVTDCLSDLDADGVVGASDLAVLLGAWGACVAGNCCLSDLNGDSQVNATDLAILLGAWGQTCDTADFCTVACSEGAEPESQSAMSGNGESEQGGSDAQALVYLALAAMGFADIASFESWLNQLSPESQLAAAVALSELIGGFAP